MAGVYSCRMKITHRCAKCQGGKLLVTHLREEAWFPAAGGTLGVRDRWYEEWSCARCGYLERYRLDAMPPRPEVDRVVQTPGTEAPYR